MDVRFIYRIAGAVLLVARLVAPAIGEPVSSGAVLRVGTSGDYNPFSFRDAAGQLTGFDIAVAARLATDLQRPVEFVPFRWPDLVTQLRTGAFNVAMSGVTVRPDRAVHVAFTRPYAVTGAVAVIRAGDREKFHGIADLDHETVRVAVNSGGHLEQVARERFAHAHLLPVARNAALPDMVLRGEADAAVSEELEARTWRSTQLVVLGPFTHDRKAYALPRDATDLLRWINDWLAAREADGWLNEQRRRWFGDQAVLTPQQACFESLIAAMDLRLQLMPLVAAVKRREHLPIEDPAQETRVLARVGAAAAAAGLNPDDVAALFRVQMDAAKTIELRETSASPPGEGADPAPSAVDVSLSDVRAAIATVSDELIAELARCQPWLDAPGWRDQLDSAVRAGLTAPGVPPAAVKQLLDGLHRLRPSERAALPAVASHRDEAGPLSPSRPDAGADRAIVAAPEWRYTEGAAGGGRYSPLTDINRDNVASLTVAWTYRHGDYYDGGIFPDYVNKGTAFESTPIMVDGRLIFTTPFNRVIALDPATGKPLWSFDPKIDTARRFANMLINRGVAYWSGPPSSSPCARRVFLATLDARLIALDAATGLPCVDFGVAGTVDLTAGVEPLVDNWEYNITSPATVVGDVVIVGSSIADTLRRVAPPGDVRAFDARTGRLLWTFHTIPHGGELGDETWEHNSQKNSGAANVWSTITADLERGLVFLPVSTPSPDFDGADRPGANLFSDAVVALRAATGERVWHFQTVHHDLWDYDLAAPPVLVRIHRDGREVDAVAQATKAGFLFVLDRDTGAPLFPVEERPVPQSDLPDERSWPTQPFPTKPPPLLPLRLDEGDLWDIDPKRLDKCRAQLRQLRNNGVFTPPSLQGTLLYPMTGGGVNWSGAGFDPATGWLYLPLGNLAHVLRLKALPPSNVGTSEGRPLRGGLSGLWWALTGRGTGLRYWTDPSRGRRLFGVDGVPCNKPPWGFLVAVDLNSGEVVWKVPAGTNQYGVQGLFGYGPLLVTAGGLVFHAGSVDLHLRAHDARTGAVLAQFDLPAGLHAGPITYKLSPSGKQYLVIAPGGHIGLGSKLGDYVIAYTLPD